MTRPSLLTVSLCSAVLGLVLAGAAPLCAAGPGRDAETRTPIEHLIVLMQQNHTFDNYFGTYPGADGIPPDTCVPVNPHDGGTSCVEPFHIGDYPDLDHSGRTFWRQYNEGRMDGFVYALRQRGQDGAQAMGYYDDRDLPYYWNLADEFVLFDRFFSSAHSGSVQNRMYSVAAVPASDSGQIPAGGYGDLPTIFDRLQDGGISWKFYVNNYEPGLTYRTLGESGMMEPQVQWLPLLGFDRYVDQPELFGRIVDLDEYFEDLQGDTLPSVAYVLALGATEHPPSSLQSGQRLVKNMIQALMQSHSWGRSAFLITYDDWGGWYDHVMPPQVDGYGYGFRVPALLVSPYAKRGYVDSTELDFTSILKFIEENWGLEPLAERDAQANSIVNAFDFSQTPREPQFIPWKRVASEQQKQPRSVVIYAGYGAALMLSGLIVAWAAVSSGRLDRRSAARTKWLAEEVAGHEPPT